MFRPIPGHRQVQSWSFKHTEGEIHIMSLQGHPTRHIDLPSKTNAILSKQREAINLLSTDT